MLVTDFWVSTGNPLRLLKTAARDRFQSELTSRDVCAPNLRSAIFELRSRMAGTPDWAQVIAKNNWFQEMAVEKLSRIAKDGAPRAIFAYSYAARNIFRFAKSRGWRTVLGQIDAGLPDERVVEKLYQQHPEQSRLWQRPPSEYWQNWQEECALADRVLVNSSWSRTALEQEGVAAEKLRVIPLVYDPPLDEVSHPRQYPEVFTASRPLRVLFLGNISVRKGAVPLFDAIRQMRNKPVEFVLVGALQVSLPDDLQNDTRVRLEGVVPHGTVQGYYRSADLFIFPTFSDGFGLTQLEAQAAGLPIIASRNCGEVVVDGQNGLLLDELSGTAIVKALENILENPAQLVQMSQTAISRAALFSLNRISDNLVNIFN
jgi:glycosyltransferase involved in cell wall biosynthesis